MHGLNYMARTGMDPENESAPGQMLRAQCAVGFPDESKPEICGTSSIIG